MSTTTQTAEAAPASSSATFSATLPLWGRPVTREAAAALWAAAEPHRSGTCVVPDWDRDRVKLHDGVVDPVAGSTLPVSAIAIAVDDDGIARLVRRFAGVRVASFVVGATKPEPCDVPLDVALRECDVDLSQIEAVGDGYCVPVAKMGLVPAPAPGQAGPARLRNLTPHALVLVAEDGIETVLQPDGAVARVAVTRGDLTSIHAPVPVYGADRGGVCSLPDPKPGVYLVVSGIVGSAIAASAIRWRGDVLVPGTGPEDDPRRDEQGRITGVRCLKVACP